ncbi:hypothetical protein [Microtetraspora glauca]|uniref:hypothetical protein n=1 Tax=unclassified Streptomyces TaxID=2593676 RepID=UPI000B2BC707
MTYAWAVYLTPPDATAAVWWGWVLRPGPQSVAWAVACGLLAAGAGLYAWRGARPRGDG